MNQKEQMKIAIDKLSMWLEYPTELGQKPSEIECVDSFKLNDIKYYVIRYKKDIKDKWLVGVAGGFKGKELDALGHTFSEFKEYKKETAKEECIQMVNMINNHWKARLNSMS